MPRVGHLYAVFRVFAYLKQKHNSHLIFDPATPEIDESTFIRQDWTKFYGDIREPILPNAPEPLGNLVILTGYVNADHAGDKVS